MKNGYLQALDDFEEVLDNAVSNSVGPEAPKHWDFELRDQLILLRDQYANNQAKADGEVTVDVELPWLRTAVATLEELAQDLEEHLTAQPRDTPSSIRRFNRDLTPVHVAKHLLKTIRYQHDI